RIRGAGIPDNTYITAIVSTTITLSQNATASGTTRLYDADLKLVGTQRKAVGAPTTGTWWKGDFLEVEQDTATQPDTDNMLLMGYKCTTMGTGGGALVFSDVYASAVSPVTP